MFVDSDSDADLETHPFAYTGCAQTTRPETSGAAGRPQRSKDGVLGSDQTTCIERYWAVSLLCGGTGTAEACTSSWQELVEQVQLSRHADSEDGAKMLSSRPKVGVAPDVSGPAGPSPVGLGPDSVIHCS